MTDTPPGQGIPGPFPRRFRRTTLKDVALAAGVSPALVSMALAGRPGPSAVSAARVLEVAQQMGYRPDRAASLLARRNTGLIGLIMTPSNPYHGEVTEAVLERAHERGYEVLLSAVSPRHGYSESLDVLVNSRCEGLVLLNPRISAPDLERIVRGIPTVCMGRMIQVPRVDVVRTDEAKAMGMLVEHLAELGHSSITHIDGGSQELAEERRQGYQLAMHRFGLVPVGVTGGETPEAGARAVMEMGPKPECTAIIAFNDLCAVGVIDQLTRTGLKVPQEVSVVGFDDSWLAQMAPVDLTTIDPAPLEQARIAVDLALDRVATPNSRRLVRTLPPRLIVRGSSTAPRTLRR